MKVLFVIRLYVIRDSSTGLFELFFAPNVKHCVLDEYCRKLNHKKEEKESIYLF